MDVNRVGSGSDALLQQNVTPRREVRDNKPAEREATEVRPAPEEERKVPRPVVNTQGQTTGTVINTTA